MYPRWWRCFSQRTLLLAIACGCGGSRDTTPATLEDDERGAASAGSGSSGAARGGAEGSGSGGTRATAGGGAGVNGEAGIAGSAAGPGGSAGSEPASPRLGRYHDSAGEPSLHLELDAVE